jgi:hypothetical protein
MPRTPSPSFAPSIPARRYIFPLAAGWLPISPTECGNSDARVASCGARSCYFLDHHVTRIGRIAWGMGHLRDCLTIPDQLRRFLARSCTTSFRRYSATTLCGAAYDLWVPAVDKQEGSAAIAASAVSISIAIRTLFMPARLRSAAWVLERAASWASGRAEPPEIGVPISAKRLATSVVTDQASHLKCVGGPAVRT